MTGYKTLSIVLGCASAFLLWRDCHRPAPLSPEQLAERCEHETRVVHHTTSNPEGGGPDDTDELAPSIATTRSDDGGLDAYGFHVPGYALSLLPQQNEDLLAYRDRIVPLAQAAVAPQRDRLSRSRADVTNVLGLDKLQSAALDAATTEAATAIQDRVLGGILGGEFNPGTFKPMTAISAARELLSIIETGHKHFMATLTEDQKAKLAAHPFDFADYLLFSTRWENAIGIN